MVWLLAALLWAALPLFIGVVVACALPGLGGPRPGLGVGALVASLLALVAVGIVIGERPVRLARLLVPRRPRLQRLGAECFVFGMMTAGLSLVLASPLGAVTAAAVSSAVYRLLDGLTSHRDRGHQQ